MKKEQEDTEYDLKIQNKVYEYIRTRMFITKVNILQKEFDVCIRYYAIDQK